jgi:hypothetical protein
MDSVFNFVIQITEASRCIYYCHRAITSAEFLGSSGGMGARVLVAGRLLKMPGPVHRLNARMLRLVSGGGRSGHFLSAVNEGR